MTDRLNVILRTCDKVEVFNSFGRPRDFGSKESVLKKCTRSVSDSIAYMQKALPDVLVNFIIIDDHSSSGTIEFLNSLNPNQVISLERGGNGPSFVECLNKALELEGPSFFVEDDYLLQKECIYEMFLLYRDFKNKGVTISLYPSDYPDRYNKPELSYIVLGKYRHWRTINHTTCTFMIDKSTLVSNYKHLYNFMYYRMDPSISEDNTINIMHKTTPCFSPIPSLGEHLQYVETLSPSAVKGKELFI